MESDAIDVVWHDEVDSTSKLARDYLNQGKPAAKAFAARKQTAGVGRQGRSWDSIDGNVHLSVALPGAMVPEALRDILPLVAGVAVVKWLERAATIRPVLKWPNDIVLDGVKVGGILCEATITGGQWTGAVIGVGVNLVAAPMLDSAAEYQAGSVLQATGVRILARLACEALARQIYQMIEDTPRAVVLSDFRRYATATDQLWQSKQSSEYWRQNAFDDAGNLSLTSLTTTETKTVNSVDHQFVWTGVSASALLVADVGNTRIKVGVCRKTKSNSGFEVGNTTQDVIAWTPGVDDPRLILEFVRRHVLSGIPPVLHVASVNAENFTKLKSAMGSEILVREIRRSVVRNIASKYDLNAIGLDRLVGVEGALALRAWGKIAGPLLVVSAGTATTIDFIDAAGVHHGGLIGVGVGLGRQALHAGTAALPLVHESLPTDAEWAKIPTKTSEAISSASIRMQAAWIERDAREWAARLGVDFKSCQILMTGGHAREISLQLSDECRDLMYPCDYLSLLGVGILATAMG